MTTPRFNQMHSAARQCRYAAVAIGGTMVDLLTGLRGTNAGSPVGSIASQLGHCISIPATGDSISMRATIDEYKLTQAAIIHPTSISGTQYITANSTTDSGGMNMLLSTGVFNVVCSGQFNQSTSITLTADPWFVAGSVDGAVSSGTIYLAAAAKNLRSGQLYWYNGTVTNQVNNSGGGSYKIGNRGGSRLNGRIACAAQIGRAMSREELILWASSPFDFWYAR